MGWNTELREEAVDRLEWEGMLKILQLKELLLYANGSDVRASQ